MQENFKNFSVLGITAAVTLKLFAFGLKYPLELRVRGDAYVYLSIANSFHSFAAVLNYAGNRTVGLPFFEFMIHKILNIFTAMDNTITWIDSICFAMLTIHFITVWFFSVWALRTNLIKSKNAALALFAFLATYPALIGHTTTPLTDTFNFDLILIALIMMEKALQLKKIYSVVLLSISVGFLFGFAILVRSGSLLGLVTALLIVGVISVFHERHKMIVIGTTLIGLILILAPFYLNCSHKYGSICLQSPQTFGAVGSAQSGLRGARTLWQKKSPLQYEKDIPTLQDKIMLDNYYSRCHLASIFGIADSSLTGCLISRPLALPAYIGKKWIGLFDHFRFTPYLELFTPFWLTWLSRAYDSLVWLGFAIFLLVPFQKQFTIKKEVLINNTTPLILVVYSLVTLAQHTIFHIEDRYSFPMIPLCTVMLVVCVEKIIENYRGLNFRSITLFSLYCILAWTMFITQIIVWDHTAFY